MNRKEFEEAEECIMAAGDYARGVTYSIKQGWGEGRGHSLSQTVTRDHLGTMRVNALLAVRKLEEMIRGIERLDPSLRD